MKAKQIKTKWMLTAGALVLALTATVGSSLAYFTTSTTAIGKIPISLGVKSELKENLVDGNKMITVVNDKDSNDAYVRVRVFAGTGAGEYSVGPASGTPENDWKQEGDWWYYNGYLEPEASTSVLKVTVPASATPETFEVIVVYEMLQVIDYATEPWAADWNRAIRENVAERITTPGASVDEEGGNE